MTTFTDVIKAWKQEEAVDRIHPLRRVGEEEYWASGVTQAEQVQDLVISHLGIDSNRIIDFGAGDGRLAIPLHRSGNFKVLAVDSSKEMLHRLTDREPEIATAVSSGSDLRKKVNDELADALVCRAVLIHHAYKDVARLVRYFAEVVRPGGLLIADWPVSDRPAERSDWIGVTTWDRSIRDEVAKRSGWEPVSVDSDPSVWVRRDDVL